MSATNAADDLEALFDQISDQRLTEIQSESNATSSMVASVQVAEVTTVGTQPADAAAPMDPNDPYDVFHRVGGLTRRLHDALRELGYDKKVENAVNSLPDTRARLSYIAKMTEQAAERALSAVEHGQGELSVVQAQNNRILTGWNKLFAKQLSLDEFKQLALDTQTHLQHVDQHVGAANAQFTEIMMAQDFQDLTGQVINKIGALVQNLEEQLVQLLLDTTPPDRRADTQHEWLNGPVIGAEGRTDVVTDQAQVDDLLESLGF